MAAYDVDYNDKRFAEVNTQKNAALAENDKTYDSMITDSDKYFQNKIDAVEQWGETQAKNQQDQTDFAIEKIEQQKDQAKSDYLKEQSGAYVDWQKQSNEYGTNAEKMAESGLAHTGYSESSQVSMYNTYQNRVATARETYAKAVLNYDNAIKDAQLQNNSLLAEIAYNTLQQSLDLSLQGFQYKNTLIIDKAAKKAEIDDRYYNRYQNVLSQINYENSMAEQIRQFNEQQAEQIRQFNEQQAEEKRQFDKNFAENQRQYNQSFAENQRQYDKSYAESKRQFEAKQAEEKRQFEASLALEKDKFELQKKNSSSSSSKKSSGSSGSAKITKPKTKEQETEQKTPNMNDAYDYLNAYIASGATKSQVSAEISKAQATGEITKEQAAQLKKVFNPRGYTY